MKTSTHAKVLIFQALILACTMTYVIGLKQNILLALFMLLVILILFYLSVDHLAKTSFTEGRLSAWTEARALLGRDKNDKTSG